MHMLRASENVYNKFTMSDKKKIKDEPIEQEAKSEKFKEIIKRFGSLMTPITDYIVATAMDMTLEEFEALLKNENFSKESDEYKAMKKSNFLSYSIENKIAKGIDVYIQDELLKYNELEDLKVIVDITEYQKQLQPFTQNQESIAITNPRNKIIRPDEEDQLTDETIKDLEEIGIVVEETEGE